MEASSLNVGLFAGSSRQHFLMTEYLNEQRQTVCYTGTIHKHLKLLGCQVRGGAISKYFEVVTVNQCQIRTLYVRAVMKWCIAYGMQDAHNNIVLQYGSNLNDKPLTGTIQSRKTYLKLTPHVFMKKSKLVNTLQLVKVEVYLYRWDPNRKGKLLPYSIISPCSHVEGKSCSVIHIHCIHPLHAINYLHNFSISQSLCIELYCTTAC